MRLLIRAVSLAGQPLTQAITGIFEDGVGTIGRAETCTLMLPDPERHISRVQAEVSPGERGHVIRNISHANPIVLNGRPIPSGRSATLAEGDELQIGSYLLRVTLSSQTLSGRPSVTVPPPVVPAAPPLPPPSPAMPPSMSTPFSELLSSPPPAPRSTPSPLLSPAFPARGAPLPSPPPASTVDPFADLWGAPPAAGPSSSGGGRSPFDDLGIFGAPSPVPPPSPGLPSGFDLGSDLGGDLGPSGARKALPSAGLDQMFGLGNGIKGTDAVDAFLKSAPAKTAPTAAGESSSLDPLDFFSGRPLTPAEPGPGLPAADRTPEVHGSMPLPRASVPESSSGLTQMLGNVKDWAPNPPSPPSPPNAPIAPAVSAPLPAPHPIRMPPAAAPVPLAPIPPASPVVPPAPVPAAPYLKPLAEVPAAPPAQAASTDALWAAFCEGAGIGLKPPGGLTPDLMRVIGQMLHHSTEGTLKLVAARAATKVELHAQVTMIQPRNNNPLKFSPDARVALEQLLQPPLRGFLAGPQAVEQAMDDLVGHAVGTMAGMRAALDGVLDRFAPDQLEAKLTRQSVLDSVLPMHRRARLWELYLQHFKAVCEDAKEDFHSLFGKAFLHAYEEQLDRLDAARHPPAPVPPTPPSTPGDAR